MKDICIILMTNKAYLKKAKFTLNKLRTVGRYNGDVVLLIGNDLKGEIDKYNVKNKNTIIKYFQDIDRNVTLEQLKERPIGDGREIYKVFQWHKIHCFDIYFKRWKKCFYLDAGMHVFKPVGKLLNLDCKNKLLAHSDSYPTYERKLKSQFDSKQFPFLYEELNSKYDLESDYFQSGIMLYDTNIIKKSIKKDLLELSNKYINSKTNEQGIFNLYFKCIKKIWNPIPIRDEQTYYYDYWERFNLKWNDYIMLKYPKTIIRNNIKSYFLRFIRMFPKKYILKKYNNYKI